jgi:serine/threonine-protein kinase
LGILATVYAIVYFIAAYLIPYPGKEEAVGIFGVPHEIVGAVFIGVALALVVALRMGRVGGRYVARIAAAFQIIGALGIDIGMLAWTGDERDIALGLSWTAVWIIVFPFLVPTSPRRTFWLATASATWRPVMIGILAWRGQPMPDIGVTAQLIVPTYVCVGIAVIAAHVVYGLGRDVAQARRMGSYELVKRLGSGGMGEVWKAEHRMLARPAAIKLIRPEVLGSQAGPIQLRRFEREVQATAQLRSPHTIAVYDYGLTDDGTFYYVMELLDGIDLHQLVESSGPLPPERAIHILRQVCHSLAEAHGRGMVHRDVKPANIFLCRYGNDLDFVKVLDFGLVKGVETEDTGASLTQFGTFSGTPAYASPEMARGETDLVDGLTDIYSAGCVAYWLITGRTVFEAATPMHMLMQHNTESPKPPSQFARANLPAELNDLILECLAKEKDARIQSAFDLDARLAEIQETHPWPADRAGQWWERFHPEAMGDDHERPATPAGDAVSEADREGGGAGPRARLIQRDA